MKFLFVAAHLLFFVSKISAQEYPVSDTLIVGGIVFEKVIIENGVSETEWRNALEKQMVPVIKKARKKLMVGTYTIKVRFLKEKDGSIADATALTDLGYGLAEAAVNTVFRSRKWMPGDAGRNNSRSYHTQLITFQIRR